MNSAFSIHGDQMIVIKFLVKFFLGLICLCSLIRENKTQSIILFCLFGLFVSCSISITSMTEEKADREKATNLRLQNESEQLINDFLQSYKILENMPDNLKKGRYFSHRDINSLLVYIKEAEFTSYAYFYDGFSKVYKISQNKLVIQPIVNYSSNPDNIHPYLHLPEPDKKYLSDLVGKIADDKTCLRNIRTYWTKNECEVMILEDKIQEVKVLTWDNFGEKFSTRHLDKSDLLDIRDGKLRGQYTLGIIGIKESRGKYISPYEFIP